jgi:hypothetical protein
VVKGLAEDSTRAAVLEIKTHNAQSFKHLVEYKLLASKPQHYDQVQLYMGLMDLTAALYFAVNKDNDDIYTEWVDFDEARYNDLIERARTLVDSPQPPAKISDNPAHYVCKMCQMHPICHDAIAAAANCRTCVHATPIGSGGWFCERHSKSLTIEAQHAGCVDHLLIPALTPYADAVDGGANWVAYKHKTTGIGFVNSGSETHPQYGQTFSSKELESCPAELLKKAAETKEAFPGATVTLGTIQWATPDDLDAATRPPSVTERKTRKAVKESLAQLEKMHGGAEGWT